MNSWQVFTMKSELTVIASILRHGIRPSLSITFNIMQDRYLTTMSQICCCLTNKCIHGNVIKWKHFPCHWPFVWGIHQSPVNSPHKGQWCGALMFSLICAWINDWVNNGEAGDLRCHRAHYYVIVMPEQYHLSINYWLNSILKYGIQPGNQDIHQ